MRKWVVAAGSVGAAVAAGEAIDAWSRRGPSDPLRPGARVAIVVLGFPGNRWVGRRIQQLRVGMARRALARHPSATVVMSGGITFSDDSEAAQMAAIARRIGIPDASIVLEDRSRTTWQNVAFTHPLVVDADRVVLVSDGPHAARARRYWLRQFPGDGARVVVDPTYRPLEGAWIKFPSAVGQIIRPLVADAILRRHRSNPTG